MGKHDLGEFQIKILGPRRLEPQTACGGQQIAAAGLRLFVGEWAGQTRDPCTGQPEAWRQNGAGVIRPCTRRGRRLWGAQAPGM